VKSKKRISPEVCWVAAAMGLQKGTNPWKNRHGGVGKETSKAKAEKSVSRKHEGRKGGGRKALQGQGEKSKTTGKRGDTRKIYWRRGKNSGHENQKKIGRTREKKSKLKKSA